MRSSLFLSTFCIFLGALPTRAQPILTGGNACQIRIQTDQESLRLSSRQLLARLSDNEEQFTFLIPVATISAESDSSDLKKVLPLINTADFISIVSQLPTEVDPQIDFSLFGGNKTVRLKSKITIGKVVLYSDVEFTGLLFSNHQKMAFNFKLFLQPIRPGSLRVNGHDVIEIEITARGDNILGLTEN